MLWRELFEAMLVATIVRTYLIKQGHAAGALRIMWAGVSGGILASVALGFSFVAVQDVLSGQALDNFQTGVLLVCAALMVHMCLWMKRHARTMKTELESSLGRALGSTSKVMLAALVAVAIAREGFECVVYLYGMGLGGGASGQGLAAAAGASIALAILSAWTLGTGLRFINPRVFFKVTGAFLLLTASAMVLTATGRLLQAGLLPPLIDQVWDLSPLLDDRSGLGRLLAGIAGYQAAPALTSVLIYAGFWLFYAAFARPGGARTARAAATAAGLIALAFWGAPPAKAQTQVSANDPKKKIVLSGYGDLQASYYRYGRNRTLKNGAPKDARVVVDATRFTAKMEGYYIPYGIEFEAEVEFEHGGTGAGMELEYEESGEFESEVAKGGEVQLEEFYLRKAQGEHVSLAAGRLLVAVGLLSRYSLPTDYLAVKRSETETTLLPGVWTEMGLGLDADYESWKIAAQLVNGLDSTGFSSQYWVARGHQGRFEEISATSPAGVLRVDSTAFPGYVFGASGYYGDSTANRPQPDLIRACNREAQDEVAPCGFVKAPVLIVDAHAAVTLTALRGSAAFIWGKLKNADKISERNARLSNNLHVLRSPVAEQARGAWGEVGYDLAPAAGLVSGSRLEPFVRHERYDTMYKTAPGIVRNARFDRRVTSFGLAYSRDGALFAKLDASRRSFGSAQFRKEDAVEAGFGFIY